MPLIYAYNPSFIVKKLPSNYVSTLTFEGFQKSKHYQAFQKLLKQEYSLSVDLELLLEGKLLVPNEEIDSALTLKIELIKQEKSVPQEKGKIASKPLTKQELRDLRVKHFTKDDKDEPKGGPSLNGF